MSQNTARHDPRAKDGDEDVAAQQARRPAQEQGGRPRQPVGQRTSAGGVSPDEPDEPDEGEFELIGDDDLGAADLGPADPNATNPDADSGRIRKITRESGRDTRRRQE
jgi:hypothetical protein